MLAPITAGSQGRATSSVDHMRIAKNMKSISQGLGTDLSTDKNGKVRAYALAPVGKPRNSTTEYVWCPLSGGRWLAEPVCLGQKCSQGVIKRTKCR